MLGVKICHTCKEDLPLTLYTTDNKTPDGLCIHCKRCYAEKRKNWLNAKPSRREKVKRDRRDYYQRGLRQNKFNSAIVAYVRIMAPAVYQRALDSIKRAEGESE